MPNWLQFERELHWGVFIAAFLAIGLWETYRPLRPLIASNTKRWAGHIVLAAFGNVTMFLTPISATAVALLAQHSSYGLLNRSVIPYWLQVCLAIVLLDLVRWFQHLCFHRFGFLWRIHRVHHADPDYDLTTTLRFHPAESFLTQGTYLLAVLAIAPPPAAAFGIELALLAQNFFGHANTTIPERIERRLRKLIVTPDMHRIHHSDEIGEQNHNYGTMFPWWDRLFGTYLDQPRQGYQQMGIGLKGYKDGRCLSIVQMLLLPLQSAATTDETPLQRSPMPAVPVEFESSTLQQVKSEP